MATKEKETTIVTHEVKVKGIRFVKIAGIVMGIGAGAFAVYELVQWIKKKFSDDSKDQTDHEKATDDSKLTHSETWYSENALAIFQTLNTYLADTNNDANNFVFGVISKLKSKSDYNKLYSVFGNKKCTLKFSAFDGGNLLTWLSNRLYEPSAIITFIEALKD